jgi:ATP-dependent DNA helicase RecQ
LVDMAAKLPTTRDTMLDVSGVGQTKLSRYGDAFMQLINDYIHREQ